jgi:hypothetical protein
MALATGRGGAAGSGVGSVPGSGRGCGWGFEVGGRTAGRAACPLHPALFGARSPSRRYAGEVRGHGAGNDPRKLIAPRRHDLILRL